MKLKDIFEASICAFGQTLFDMHSLEEDEFLRALDSYLNDSSFDEMLEEYSYEFDYDTVDMQEKCNNSSCNDKELDYLETMNCCRLAFIKTITQDKTIDAEAFIDNIINEFNKINE